MAPSIDITQIPALQKDYWDRPPSRDKGDPDANQIFRAVGYALTCWEICEERLASVFQMLIETSNRAAVRAYGAIESNSGRRKVIMAAAEVFFGKDWNDRIVRQAFTRYIEAVGWASSRRDDIAHGIVIHWKILPDDFGCFHMPPLYNTGRTNAFIESVETDRLAITQAKYRYTSDDINGIGDKFNELRKVIWSIGVLLLRRDGRIPFVEAVKG